MDDSSIIFGGKFRLPSSRLCGWDYASPGYYFVTICTRAHHPWFGRLVEEQMVFSLAGKIAEQELELTPKIRPYVSLESWIVMPNHIHAIINQYKSICTKRIRAMGMADFARQPRFYDHIIRNDSELENINAYILANPTQWAEDEYF